MAETDCFVYVDTSLDTHLVVLVHNNVTISDFKEKLCKDHQQCFPKTGEIDISAVKVKRENPLGLVLDYHLPDSMRLSKAFDGVSNDSWFVFVDAAVRVVGNRELVDGDENRLNHELVVATGSLLLDGYTKNPEQEFENEVVEKKTEKKRKLKSSDGEKRRKKRSVDPDQSAADATASRFDVGESHELRGNVQVEVVAAAESSPREKLDDTLTEATGKEMEMGEKSVEDAGRDRIQTDKLVSRTENHLDTNSGLTTRTDTEKKIKRKKRSKDDIEQSSAAAITDSRDIVNENEVNGVSATVDPVDVTLVSLPVARGDDLDNPVAEASQREIEMGEKSVEDVGTDNIETGILVSHAEDLLDTNSGLTTRADTEKKERRKKRSKDDTEQPSVKRKKRSKDDTELSFVKRKKRSKDDISQSSAAAITTSRDIVNENESNGVPANVDPVDATPISLPVARGENLDNPVAEASQKEIEMGEKSVEDVERDSIKTDNLVSHTEDLLDTNSGLTTRADTEKKERRNKRSKDDIEQSAARRKKSSKGDINQSSASGDYVNEINGVPAHDLPADATPESVPIVVEARQKEAETGEKIDDAVGGAKAITSAADNIQPSIEIDADEAKSVKLAKKIKSKKTKTPAKEDILVASGAQNVEPLEVVDGEGTAAKKIKSRKTKTSAKEDTLVASGAQNVEPVEVVDGEGTDNVIRNVLDSLQENNETEEDLEKTGKKSSKKLKKKHSLKVAESLVSSVEVNNAALEETPPINNRNDTDAFFTPAKKDTESDASVLKKISEVSDNADLHPSGSIDGSLSSMKPKAKKSRVQQPTSSGTSLLQSVVKNDRSRSVKAAVNSMKQDVKTSAKPVTVERRKTNFFEGAEINSSEDEHNKTSDVSTKTPSDYSSDDDSDVTSMSRKQGNNLDGGTNKLSGSLQDILRRSSSYKKALIRAQSQPDILDDVDCVPDSQAV